MNGQNLYRRILYFFILSVFFWIASCTSRLPNIDTGLEGKAGRIVTSGGLIFIAGAEDKKFRAFEKTTGKLLWETTLPSIANATACTYMVNGKQFVALSVGGTTDNPSGSIMAFSLPDY